MAAAMQRYDEAIAAYQRGYEISRRPGFLFNIALAPRLRRSESVRHQRLRAGLAF